MKSMFRDRKYVILVLVVFVIAIPVISDLFTTGGFNPYAFVDAMVSRIVWFVLFMTILYYYDLAVIRLRISRGKVKQTSELLKRNNGKRAPILDLRDARKLIASAEAAVLVGETEYAVLVADHVRSDRRDLFQKSAVLRYEHARTMVVLELLRESADEAKRHYSAMTKALKGLPELRRAFREPEQKLFLACIRMLEVDTEDEVLKLREAARECTSPIRQALVLKMIIRHYDRIGRIQSRDSYSTLLKEYSGDAAFLAAAGCRDTWIKQPGVFEKRIDPKLMFAYSAALLAASIALLTTLNILSNLRHGGTNVVGWTTAAVFAIVLGILGSFRPLRAFARTGILFGILFLFFATVSLFDFYPLSTRILSDPIEKAETISGIDFMLDGKISSIGQWHEYDILQILEVRVSYGSPTNTQLATEIGTSGLFMTKTNLESAVGDDIPDVIEEALDYSGNRYMLVNLTEGTFNVLSAEPGPDVMLLISWDALYGELICIRYINF
ncbi:MAG: hypothetical protein A2Y16_03210 [Tenericutes bacterium GWF2_57_13]|nr:MAG: hypothetical protein A2Y16_03210 [Tenericutes bacterium GWF2_57_13]